MKAKRNAVIKGFFSAVALLTVFHMPLVASSYEESYDFYSASIYELLGEYPFIFLPVWFVLSFFFFYSDKLWETKSATPTPLACFFSLCLLVGNSYAECGSSRLCFGSLVNWIKFAICLIGYLFLFRELIGLLCAFMEKSKMEKERKGFWAGHVFKKSFLILFLSFSPFLLLSYPGNLCWDVIGQIEQVIADKGYSTHHPLIHTLIVGNCVKLGKVMFCSYEIGLFFYVILQTALLVTALAMTLKLLEKRGLSTVGLWCVLALYCITPAYSNITSTAIKDVPFIAFVIGYVMCIACLLEEEAWLGDRRLCVLFATLQIGVIWFRNNGMPLIVLTDMGCFLYLRLNKRSRKQQISFVLSSTAAVAIAKISVLILVQVLNAEPGSKGEILSIPFQQTARYLQVYRSELDAAEKDRIEAVLGDVNVVAEKYDPRIADPVKALFRADASVGELAGYFVAWGRGLLRHPGVYVEAFLVHIYGWFDPAMSTAVRYETDYDGIRQTGLFANAEKILIFYYRFADRIALFGALQNVGMAVWALFFLDFYQRKMGSKALYRMANLPLWISLLICMASPCFINHPRYAFPILFTLPFLYGFTLSGCGQESLSEGI